MVPQSPGEMGKSTVVVLPDRVWSSRREPIAWPRWVIAAIGTITIAITYFLAARLSLVFLEKSDGVAVFWPAAGLASGILIAVGPVARWPVVSGVMAATIAANLLGDRNLPSSVFFAVANAGEALLIAGLIERFCGSPFELNSLRRVLGLFAATAVGTAVSGIAGTLGFVFFHSPTASIPTIWFHWFASDALGTITVAPVMIAVASLMRDFPPRSEAIEGILALTILSVLCALSIFLPNQRWTLELAVALLCPLFVWIAARFRPAFTAVATFMCAITIVWTTTFAIGIFGDPRLSIEERILSAQAAILATSFGALVLAALFSERRLHETAIVERESRLQDALQAGRVFAFNWDLLAEEVRHGQNGTQILGAGTKPVFSSAEWLARIHPDDRPRVAAVAKEVHPNASSHAVAFRYLRPSGDEVWLEQIAVTEFDTGGKPKRVHGLTTDITERMRFEREILSARRSAELADRAKSSFLAAASHDLRQPLQTLRFLQGALERHHPDGEGRELVVGVGRSLDTMSSILSSLLDVNRLETGNLCPAKTEFAVNDIFDSVMIDFCRPIEEKRLRRRLVRSGLWLYSDRRMLEEMIRNLLSNALRYTDRGKILLGCRRAGDNARIEVWDSGVGITADQLPHIFEEYYQGPGAERGGFGLGLAIVKRLGDTLDHKVDVRSVRGKGTGVSILVPLAQASAGEPVSAQPPDCGSDAFHGSILVVEDETSVRSALKRLLKTMGIRSLIAGTTSEALAQIEQENIRPDLVLCDYNLRGSANGLESIKDLRAALGWDVPAIVMTGDTRSDTIEEIASRDVSVLIKPFAANELLQRIEQLHRSSRSRDDD
jgi:signal transduction histidine kinase/CheY-like chemotaxis protein